MKIAKIYSQITIAAWMQPLQYDLRCSAAKDNSITHAAEASTNVEHTRCRAPASSPKHRTTPQEQPLVAKHIEGTNRVRNDRSRNRRTDEVPFIVACSHFTRKNTRFRAPASSPKHSPCNIHAAIPMRSATTASGNA